MEDLQCDLGSEEEAKSEVLRMRMGLMTKDYEKEKNEIMKATDKTIEKLKATNEELNIKIGDQSDKMHKMDKESAAKDKEIESLTKRANELSMQKKQLEIDLKHATEMYEQQDERIKKLELELSEVNKKLEAIRIAKEEQESRFATLLKEADEKQERRDKDTNEKQERRDKEASEKQERRDKEANEKQEQRDKHFFDMMEKRHTEVLSQIKSLDIRPTSPPARKESKLSITDVHNVQITLDSPKIRNDAALPKNISFK
jgi:chromosome segregation ATPase